MKVLFAVSNEEISESVVKRYQREYKEIISYKNVYYFNAILKEIQKDKSYDRIVISEDLESFTHTQYDQIDKFLFEKLDSISDEASNARGDDIPIILICSDRRTKSEQMLSKIFGIGIYNAIIGNDRSVEEVCNLIRKPRSKKEAKIYYKIDSEDVGYEKEDQNEVSETEMQNILAHYKRLGKDEEKYVQSFDSIAAQYNDTQLKIICKYLPLNVRAVLEEKSEKYQKLMAFNSKVSESLRKAKKVPNPNEGHTEKLLKPKIKEVGISKPVVIPSAVNIQGNKKLSRVKKEDAESVPNTQPEEELENMQYTQSKEDIENIQIAQSKGNEIKNKNQEINGKLSEQPEILNQNTTDNEENQTNNDDEEVLTSEPIKPVKRGRGRPKKNPEQTDTENKPKRGRGRPKKIDNLKEESITMPGFDTIEKEENTPSKIQEETIIPGFEEDENTNNFSKTNNTKNQNEGILPGLDNNDDLEENLLPGLEDDEEDEENATILPGFDDDEDESKNSYQEKNESLKTSYNEPNQTNNQNSNYNIQNQMSGYGTYNTSNTGTLNNGENYSQARQKTELQPKVNENIDIASLITQDKKIICFVGTSKNGTSFIVNNIAQILASRGIDTAILDTTKNRNSYYIYTKNEEELRNIASTTLENLVYGSAEGIQATKNLSVYTSMPTDQDPINNSREILQTLIQKHSLLLIDCDFNTPIDYFKQAQEIYLVQSLDVLTIQPLTAFLRELKAKNILEERKIKIVLNKTIKVKGVNEKAIIGGMAFYNDPSMSFMTELFDRNLVKYITIPFDDEVYSKYLSALIECEISLKGYPKHVMQSLNELANMVYPLVSGKSTYKPPTAKKATGFTPSMNQTLDQMRKY